MIKDACFAEKQGTAWGVLNPSVHPFATHWKHETESPGVVQKTELTLKPQWQIFSPAPTQASAITHHVKLAVRKNSNKRKQYRFTGFVMSTLCWSTVLQMSWTDGLGSWWPFCVTWGLLAPLALLHSHSQTEGNTDKKLTQRQDEFFTSARLASFSSIPFMATYHVQSSQDKLLALHLTQGQAQNWM